MAIIVLGGRPMARAMVTMAVGRARRKLPDLGVTGRDVVILTDDCSGYDPSQRSTALVVMTARPSAVEAATALLIGADAYLPLDLEPSQTAAALRRVGRGQLHIEPETAAALQTLANLTKGLLPHRHASDICLALRLRSRGWEWSQAVESVGVDTEAACGWLKELLERVRFPSEPSTIVP